MKALKIPPNLEEDKLKPLQKKLKTALSKGEIWLDLSELESFDLMGLQLLISTVKSTGAALELGPRDQAMRIKSMMDFCGLPWSRYFKIRESNHG